MSAAGTLAPPARGVARDGSLPHFRPLDTFGHDRPYQRDPADRISPAEGARGLSASWSTTSNQRSTHRWTSRWSSWDRVPPIIAQPREPGPTWHSEHIISLELDMK